MSQNEASLVTSLFFINQFPFFILRLLSVAFLQRSSPLMFLLATINVPTHIKLFYHILPKKAKQKCGAHENQCNYFCCSRRRCSRNGSVYRQLLLIKTAISRAKSRPFSRISHLNTLDVQICTSPKKANTVTIINMSANGGKLIGYNCRREA